MLKTGSLYIVGVAHVETGHRMTYGLVLDTWTSLRDALADFRRTLEKDGITGYDVEFAVGTEAFHRDYSHWPIPHLGLHA